MSRSGYCDEIEDMWQLIRWRGAVNSAIRGKRGQALLIELRDALDAMPSKRLIADDLVTEEGDVCALGAVGRVRGIELKELDPEEYEQVAGAFNIAEALAREVVWMNDEAGNWNETPEDRWKRIRAWVESQIQKPKDAAAPTRKEGDVHG